MVESPDEYDENVMTVAEVIELLRGLPQDQLVCTWQWTGHDDTGWEERPIVRARIRTGSWGKHHPKVCVLD